MEIQPAELIDKMTILKLKIEKLDSLELRAEYEEYERAIEGYRKQGVEVKPEWFDRLYEYNREQWEIYAQLRDEKNGKRDLETIGRLYIAVEKSNKKRVAIKNEIVNVSGKGFRDIKMN